MKLTAKAKDKFEKWYFSLPNSMGLNYGTIDLTMNRFYCLPESMQWGIYQDWADSIGYPIETYIWYCSDDGNNYYGAEVRYQDVSDYNKTRQEARNAAIEKLNEIINKQ